MSHWLITITISYYSFTVYIKPRPHQQQCQHCRMLQSRMLLWQSRTFFRYCCRFSPQCRTKFRLFDKVETKLNMCNLFRLCRKDEISRKPRLTLLPKTATMSKQHSTLWHSTMLLRHCCWCGRGFMFAPHNIVRNVQGRFTKYRPPYSRCIQHNARVHAHSLL